MNKRWLRVGLLALGLFAVNVIARVVTEIGDVTEESTLDLIAYGGLGVVAVAQIVAGAWWAVRYPFVRLCFDLGAVALAFALLSIFIGPLFVGVSPFANGPEFIVGQFLLLFGVALGAALLGFATMVAFAKDWKSQRLRQYEKSYHRRPNRAVRG